MKYFVKGPFRVSYGLLSVEILHCVYQLIKCLHIKNLAANGEDIRKGNWIHICNFMQVLFPLMIGCCCVFFIKVKLFI